MFNRHRILSIRWAAAVMALLTGLYACTDQPTSVSEDFQLAKGGPNGGGGGGKPEVNGTDPSEAPQGVTLDVRVLGSGYDDGSSVTLLRKGKPAVGIVTNTTAFVSENELVANVTIAEDADTVFYDVEVLTARKRRGVGTEMFRVKLGPWEPNEIDITLTPEVRAGTANGLLDDGLGSYPEGVCGVFATTASSLSFRPVDFRLRRKEIRELENPNGPCAGVYPRAVSVNLLAARVHEYCLNPADEGNCPTDFYDHSDEPILAELVALGVLDDPGVTALGTAQVRFFDAVPDGSGFTPGGFNVSYCSGGDSNRPFRFSPDRHPDNSDYFVVGEQGGVTTVATQPFPDNMGTCLREQDDGSVVIILFHLDIRYDYAVLP